MKPSAVLLIDLENFYCSREDYCRNGPTPNYDRVRFSYDLDRLLAYTRAMTADRSTAAELPFTVRRAYADFNVVRYLAGAPPQHYLRQLPEEILNQGIEPVQVFRLSRGGKNAADMRMAMDATSLLFSAEHVEHFVLVTGDADFIPVILELKRHGRTVSVIGVTGATSPKIQRFVDNFDLFEDLIAAEEVEARSGELAQSGDPLALIGEAVRRLLARSHILRFAAVKPLLSKELGHPFDPALFGCDTTGDFLRNHQAALGIVIRQGQHDSEIVLPGTAVNGANGNGSRVVSRPPARQPDKPAEKAAPAKQPAPGPEPHTAAHYRQLLTSPRGAAADREGKVYGVPWPALVWACDAIVPLLTPPIGEPTHTTKLQPKLVAATDRVAIPEILKHVRLFYPTLRAGLPVQGADGVYSLPEGTDGDGIRRSVLGYIAFVLKCRLAESGVAGDVRPDQLAAVFDPGAAVDQATAEFAIALTDPPPEPTPKPVAKPAPKPAVVEEFHSVAGYVKLLKAGGPKGSETEAFKVLPVPWPSVERICADTFSLLCPAAGGAPQPRDQFTARVIDAGKDLYIEKYDQHVRRVLGILRLAGEVDEVDGQMSIISDVASGHDLRSRALAFLLQLLQLRLEEREVYDPIRPKAFVAALEAGPLTDRLLEEVKPAVEWLYRPSEGEPPFADLVEEPQAEEQTESAPADVLDLQHVPADPTTDSGVVTVHLGPVGTRGVAEPEPTPAIPEALPAEPDGDVYVFDGELPELDTGNDPVPPEVRHEAEPPTASVRSDPTPEAVFAPTAPAEPLEESGEIDFAALTSEAVAAAAVDLTPSMIARGEKPHAQPHAPAKKPEPESDPDAYVSLGLDTPSFRNESPTEVFRTEDLLGVLPFAELLPDGELLVTEIDLTGSRFGRPNPAPGAARPVPPLPLFPMAEEVPNQVDRIKPPPTRRVPPPPLSPPESV